MHNIRGEFRDLFIQVDYLTIIYNIDKKDYLRLFKIWGFFEGSNQKLRIFGFFVTRQPKLSGNI